MELSFIYQVSNISFFYYKEGRFTGLRHKANNPSVLC